MTVENSRGNKLALVCICSFLLFLGGVGYVNHAFAESSVLVDADGDGFDDTKDDKCPGQYGTVQGCFTYNKSLSGSNTLLTKANIVIPPCTSPTGCACTAVQDQQMLQKGDTLLIQIKGTPHVSVPFEVK